MRAPPRRYVAAILGAALALAAASAPRTVHAHEVRPAYLELAEAGGGRWEVLWKVPARGAERLAIYVRLPEDCRGAPPAARLVGGAHLERWQVACETPLEGRRVSIDGLPATRTDVLARVERADGSGQTVRLTPEAPAFTVEAAAGSVAVAWTYLVLGVEHILLGVDHLLFVLALLFLVGGWRRLVGTVTAFTVAHSVTLAAATLGWVRVAQAPVEAAIALSIVFVAVEVLRGERGSDDLAERKPWIVAFAFGLLHGFGFAGALRDVGLPGHAIPLALAFFNVGVELGQLLFVAAVFAALALARPLVQAALGRPDLGTWDVAARVARPASWAIGVLAAYWMIDRTLSFWGA